MSRSVPSVKVKRTIQVIMTLVVLKSANHSAAFPSFAFFSREFPMLEAPAACGMPHRHCARLADGCYGAGRGEKIWSFLTKGQFGVALARIWILDPGPPACYACCIALEAWSDVTRHSV